jgi:hypothetical protein
LTSNPRVPEGRVVIRVMASRECYGGVTADRMIVLPLIGNLAKIAVGEVIRDWTNPRLWTSSRGLVRVATHRARLIATSQAGMKPLKSNRAGVAALTEWTDPGRSARRGHAVRSYPAKRRLRSCQPAPGPSPRTRTERSVCAVQARGVRIGSRRRANEMRGLNS